MSLNLRPKFIVYAPAIKGGGGLVLLRQIVGILAQNSSPCVFICHNALIKELLPAVKQSSVVDTCGRSRLAVEWELRSLCSDSDRVLCFGNLPPLFPVKGLVTVFLQNRLLLPLGEGRIFGSKVGMRLRILRLWLKWRAVTVDRFMVQSPSMQRALTAYLKHPVSVVEAALNEAPRSTGLAATSADKVYDFIYVGSGEPHKNHSCLLDAWVLLAQQGHRPSLLLTIDAANFSELDDKIKAKTDQYRLSIHNVGQCRHDEIGALYKQAKAMIFPSLCESFGLPLLEAKAYHLPVLASECDYVRDLIDPEATFDPNSAWSIARAVMRFLNIPDRKVETVPADLFLERAFAPLRG